MKKIINFLSLFLLTSCTTQATVNDNIKKPENIISESNKTLVVYFSRTGENYAVGNIEVGNTAIMASYIKDKLNCDIYEIIPTVKYPDSYNECLTIATQEKNTDARPEIKNELDSISQYDTIYIGYPIWYGSYPQIILTFLDSYNFDGKHIYPFCTNEGSGLAGTVNRLASYLPSSNVHNGLAIRGASIRNEASIDVVNKWIEDNLKNE